MSCFIFSKAAVNFDDSTTTHERKKNLKSSVHEIHIMARKQTTVHHYFKKLRLINLKTLLFMYTPNVIKLALMGTFLGTEKN